MKNFREHAGAYQNETRKEKNQRHDSWRDMNSAQGRNNEYAPYNNERGSSRSNLSAEKNYPDPSRANLKDDNDGRSYPRQYGAGGQHHYNGEGEQRYLSDEPSYGNRYDRVDRHLERHIPQTDRYENRFQENQFAYDRFYSNVNQGNFIGDNRYNTGYNGGYDAGDSNRYDIGLQHESQRLERHPDPDYHQWRREQIRNLDNDYDEWRKERYQKFSNDFDTWRATRSTKQAGNDKLDLENTLATKTK